MSAPTLTAVVGTPVYNGGSKFGSGALSGGGLAAFDVDDFLATSGDAGGTLTTGTVEAWVKVAAAGFKVIASRHGWYYLCMNNAGNPEVQYGWSANTLITGTMNIADNNWHHVAMVLVNGACSLYVDGVLAASNATVRAADSGFDQKFFVGTHANGLTNYQWPGSIDEVRVSNIARYSGSTYTVPTAAFTPDANTKALYHLESSGVDSSDYVPVAGRVNLITNPSFEVNTSGWTGLSSRASTEVNHIVDGGFYATLSNASPAETTKAPAVAGLPYTGSVWISRLSFSRDVAVSVHFFDDANTELSAPTITLTALSTQTQRFSSTRTAPAGTTQVSVRVTTTGIISIDAALLEQSAAVGSFFSGATPNDWATHAWAGTPHASFSTESTPTIRANLLKNPSFESGTKFGWSTEPLGGTTTVVSNLSRTGSNSLRMSVAALNQNVYGTNGSGLTAEMAPVTPGLTYTLSAYVTLSEAKSVTLTATGADASGVATGAYRATTIAVPEAAWTRIETTFVARAGDAYAWPTLRITSPTILMTMHIDDVMLEPAAVAGTYFDGSTANTSSALHSWTGAASASTSLAVNLPSVVQVVAGSIQASNDATVTATLTNPIVPGDIVVAMIATNAANTNHTVAGLGATWTRAARDTNNALLDMWVGIGATSTGTVTATQTFSIAGGFKYLNLWHVRGTTSAYAGFADDATSDTLYSGGNLTGPGQVFIGAGYATEPWNAFIYPAPTTGWVETAALELSTGQRYASRVHRIPSTLENHRFSTIRAGSTAHPIVRVRLGTAVSPLAYTQGTRTNLLTNPSFERDKLGWTGTLTRQLSTPTRAFEGSTYSSLSSANSESTPIPATPGSTYAASTYLTRGAAARDAAVSVHFYNASGVELSPPTINLTPIATEEVSQQFGSVRTAPAGAATVSMRISALAGYGFYIDAALLEKSSVVGSYFSGDTTSGDRYYSWDGVWHASQSTVTLVPPAERTNLFKWPSAEAEYNPWTPVGANRTVTRVETTLSNLGSYAWVVAITSGTTTEVTTPTGVDGIPVLPNKDYTYSVHIRSGSSARTIIPKISWYTAAGALIATMTGSGIDDGNSYKYSRMTMTDTAPPTAAFAALRYAINSVGVNENHYMDNVLFEQTSLIQPYFDGSFAPAGFLSAWTGTPHESTSTATANPVAPAITMTMKHFESGAWATRTAKPKVRVGGVWVEKRPKRWNGSAWVDLA